MSILPKGFSMVLKILTVLLDQKITCWWEVSFSSVISMQTRWLRKDISSGVYLVQPNINTETQILKAAIWPTKVSYRTDDWNVKKTE